jgi:L-iditol 2-dehydrogenase
LLEPLGVAVFATDLARLRVGDSVSIIGAGPIGLLILQLVRLSGADPVFVVEKLPHRLRLAERFGGIPVPGGDAAAVRSVLHGTASRGVDVAIEAAWGDDSVEMAAEMLRPGGRLVLVGIPSDDRLQLKHSTARRKGLTIVLSRRMKHAYPRAIRLACEGRVDLRALITHHFPLSKAREAFELNATYREDVIKVMVES